MLLTGSEPMCDTPRGVADSVRMSCSRKAPLHRSHWVSIKKLQNWRCGPNFLARPSRKRVTQRYFRTVLTQLSPTKVSSSKRSGSAEARPSARGPQMAAEYQWLRLG